MAFTNFPHKTGTWGDWDIVRLVHSVSAMVSESGRVLHKYL